jgi:hypothetical protein
MIFVSKVRGILPVLYKLGKQRYFKKGYLLRGGWHNLIVQILGVIRGE